MGRRHQEELAVGEDSFMDTIANLVGIMIILVVIVGARGYTSAKAEAQSELKSKMEELSAPLEKAANLDRDIESQLEQLRKYEDEITYRNAERLTLVDRISLAEHLIEEHTKELDESQLADVVITQELTELEKELLNLTQQQGGLSPKDEQAIVLQHLPTPMAKTVFGQEVHVMVKDHLVTVIPWDSLVDTLKEQVRRTVARNTQREKMEDRLGPIDGFMMRYRLISRSGVMSDGRTAALGRMIELDRFELEPTPDAVRETVDETLGTGGRLQMELSMIRSKQTTVTVWVYPDSFATYRQLKDQLFKRGFLCAARPLPENMRIGASPRGSSSVAQ